MADTGLGPRTIPRPAAARVPAELLDRVVAYFNPRRVYLFGSVARGDQRPDSDIDLLVILDNDAPREMQTLAAGFESRRGYRKPTDVIPCTEATFRRSARIGGTIAHSALTEGIVVYERS